mgnify:CR=1 FL=1
MSVLAWVQGSPLTGLLLTLAAYRAALALSRRYHGHPLANTVLIGATVHGKVAQYTPHAAELPLAIQDHGNIESHVGFRNIWVRRLSPE